MADVEPEEGELSVSFDGRWVAYGFGELDTLVPAYAASIHKSQGSEYPAEADPGHDATLAMLQRNLLYTGATDRPGKQANQAGAASSQSTEAACLRRAHRPSSARPRSRPPESWAATRRLPSRALA